MTDYIEQINELIENNQFASAKSLLEQLNPTDIAIIFNEAELSFLPRLYRLLPKELAAETFVELSNEMQQALIDSFSDSELRDTLKNLYADDTVDIIEEMPSNMVKRLLAHCDPEKRAAINELLRYPDDSAGSIMTVEFVDLKMDMTVQQAFEKIRKTGVNKETVYTCYVTDAKRTLVGMISARTLLLSSPEEKIENLMEKNVISGKTSDDREEVARTINKYGFLALPIVDNENRLVGIVTVDDAMDVINEENEEDFSIMAAIQPVEDTYFKTSVWKHSGSRIIWLLVLMLSATVTGLLLNHYEPILATIPLLYSFVPMLMDTGGNSGSQSSTTIIRGLAVGEIKPKQFLKVIFKEARIGIICSIILAVVNGIRVILMYWWNDTYDNTQVIAVSIVLAITLVAVVVISKLLGGILPILAKVCKLDPALMASPLITTIIDAVSIVVYFGISLLIMPLFGITI